MLDAALNEASLAIPLGDRSGTARSSPCTMHTYFASQASSESEQAANDDLIATWRRAWESSGWKTRVISEDDAKSHPEYATLREVFMKLPTVSGEQSLQWLDCAHVRTRTARESQVGLVVPAGDPVAIVRLFSHHGSTRFHYPFLLPCPHPSDESHRVRGRVLYPSLGHGQRRRRVDGRL